MQKHHVAILSLFSVALIGGGVACSSSSSTGGSTTGTDAGTDSGSTDGGKDAGSGDASTGCVSPGAPGNSDGVGKYCDTFNDCAGQTANICAVIGDPTQHFCTFLCTPSDGGADPCGTGATCECQGQCGCTPNACL